GGIIRSDQTSHRPVCEMKRKNERAIGSLVRFVGHLRHDRVNGTTQKLQHVKSVALGFEQVVERVASAALASETPGCKGQIPQSSLLNGVVRQSHRPGIMMIKIDSKE